MRLKFSVCLLYTPGLCPCAMPALTRTVHCYRCHVPLAGRLIDQVVFAPPRLIFILSRELLPNNVAKIRPPSAPPVVQLFLANKARNLFPALHETRGQATPQTCTAKLRVQPSPDTAACALTSLQFGRPLSGLTLHLPYMALRPPTRTLLHVHIHRSHRLITDQSSIERCGSLAGGAEDVEALDEVAAEGAERRLLVDLAQADGAVDAQPVAAPVEGHIQLSFQADAAVVVLPGQFRLEAGDRRRPRVVPPRPLARLPTPAAPARPMTASSD